MTSTESSFIPTVDVRDPKAVEIISKVSRDVGFFYLVGHGLSEEEIDSVFNESKALFALSVDEKTKLSDKSLSRGYTAMQEQTFSASKQTEGDTKEGYYIGRDIPMDHPKYNPAKLSGPNQWPDPSKLPNFQRIMTDFHTKTNDLAVRVVRLIALGLGLEESHFDEAFEDSIATLRLIHYDQRKSDPDQGIFACGAHSDFGIVTLLLTDHNPGLQIYYQDEWIDVPPKAQAFVINIGDMLELWTNGLYKSTIHRVLTKGDGERYSIPFFLDPKFDAIIKCLDCCTDEDSPPKYRPTTAGEYLLSRLAGTHTDFVIKK